MKAQVSYTDHIDSSEIILINSHKLQFGGPGDGYCYIHQTFDCIDELSFEEWNAIDNI